MVTNTIKEFLLILSWLSLLQRFSAQESGELLKGSLNFISHLVIPNINILKFESF